MTNTDSHEELSGEQIAQALYDEGALTLLEAVLFADLYAVLDQRMSELAEDGNTGTELV
jgi:hypothetical protein